METLHFAYGSNMVMSQMARRCPHSRPVGTAALPGWRFRINAAGWATIVPEPGARVYGRLWDLTAADEVALDVYEELPSGLYFKNHLNLESPLGGQRRVMIYLAHDVTPGRPETWYYDPILDSAEDSGFPPEYLEELRTWSPPER